MCVFIVRAHTHQCLTEVMNKICPTKEEHFLVVSVPRYSHEVHTHSFVILLQCFISGDRQFLGLQPTLSQLPATY